MSERRTNWVYVTADELPQEQVTVNFPIGLIPPPFIDLSVPLAGSKRFYHVESYRLKVER